MESQYPWIYDLPTNARHTERLVRSTDEGYTRIRDLRYSEYLTQLPDIGNS
jgi:hypothetical protein